MIDEHGAIAVHAPRHAVGAEQAGISLNGGNEISDGFTIAGDETAQGAPQLQANGFDCRP